MDKNITWFSLLRRLWWDLRDPLERQYYGYWFISELPGLFGHNLRARYIAKRMKKAGVRLKVMAGTRFRSLENIEIGDDVNIGFDNFLQGRGGLTIGNKSSFAPGVKIWSSNHEYDDRDVPIRDQGHSDKPVVIGDDVFIGSNAFILPGTVLPRGCIVCAGAIVGSKPYQPFSILAGNPARVIGYRGGSHAPATEAAAQAPELTVERADADEARI